MTRRLLFVCALLAGLAASSVLAVAAAGQVDAAAAVRPVEADGAIRPLDVRSAIRGVDRKASVLPLQRTRENAGRVEIDVSADVLFAFGRARLTARAREVVNDLAKRLENAKGGRVLVVGHTDSIGSARSNRLLSRRRAAAVAQVLRSARPDAKAPRTVGYGESRPVAPNTKDDKDNPEGRAMNRRVTITAG